MTSCIHQHTEVSVGVMKPPGPRHSLTLRKFQCRSRIVQALSYSMWYISGLTGMRDLPHHVQTDLSTDSELWNIHTQAAWWSGVTYFGRRLFSQFSKHTFPLCIDLPTNRGDHWKSRRDNFSADPCPFYWKVADN